ncbi:MAG: hypothetical protein OXF26_09550 [Alphaproteobacteria bacterium]|nr:hypothetical protein [Alphaproteobacteria bacterium]MCY4318520.1 hypothetical protein [Alphaproteobacteria bacterium]
MDWLKDWFKILTLIVSIGAIVIYSNNGIGERFSSVDARFNAIDARFNAIDGSINALRMEMASNRQAFQASIDTFHAEAAADRRTFQISMDQFQQEMQRLAERQAALEGWQESKN